MSRRAWVARRSIKEMADAGGRDPSEIKMVIRANVHITEQPLDDRWPYVGSWEQVISDIEETRWIDADELFIDPQGETPEGFLSVMERVKR